MIFASDILNNRAFAVDTTHTGILARGLLKLRLRHEYRKTRDALASLSDRTLADLGMSRSDIPEMARIAVYGRHG